MSEFDIAVRTITVYLIPVLFAISLHEAAHGYVARYFGDPTAANEGRLSLNPIRHIDPFGTVLLPLLLHYIGLPPFGYARPVPVDFGRLRNPKKQMAFVAAAGPGANFAMGLAWMVFWVVLLALDAPDFFVQMAKAGVSVNSAMCVFNLIPIPPLDGGRIVTGLLPMPYARQFAQIERYGFFVFIGLIVLMQLGVLNGALLAGMTAVQQVFYFLVTPLIYLLN
ncbi:site-2 protease family protein [Oxalobacteraceae bacterium A2-2]